MESLPIDETTQTDLEIGPFQVESKQKGAGAFAQLLAKTYHTFKDRVGLGEVKTGIKIKELGEKEAQQAVDYFRASFTSSHAGRFNIEIDGVFTFDTAEPFPKELKDLWYHGTDASRATSIIGRGFEIPPSRKTDRSPMYGVGICLAENSSKSAGYFHSVDGYNDRDPDPNGGGVVFLIRPNRGKVYTAPGAMWGDTIKLASGETARWQDHFDSVYALSATDPGEHVGRRPNFREITLKKPEQAQIVAAFWCKLVPKGSPGYNETNPVIYKPVK